MRAAWYLGVLFVAMGSACGGGSGNAGGPDSSADIPQAELVGDGAGVSDATGDGVPTDSGLEDDTRVPSGPYAFVLESEAEGLPGIDSVGRKGDLAIGNERIQAVIGGMDHSIWGPYGGGVLDFSAAGLDDGFEEVFASAGFLRGVRAKSIEVVSDGSDGEALIRVTGTDGPIPLVAAVVPTPPAGIEVVVEYALRADSDCLEIRTSVTNPTDLEKDAPVGDGLVFSEVGRTFGASGGFDVDKVISAGELDFIGSDVSTVSFLMTPPSGKHVTVALSEEELNVVTYETLQLDPGETRTAKRCLYAAPGRSIGVLERYWEDRNVKLVDVAGDMAIDTPGYDFSQVALDITDSEGGFFGAAQPDATGKIRFRVPEGSYSVTVSGPGLETYVVPLEVEEGPAEGQSDRSGEVPGEDRDRAWQGVFFDLDPADPGRIDVQISGEDGNPVSARIMAFAGADADLHASRLGIWPDIQGKTTLFLPAGQYTFQGSRGPQWTYCRTNVDVSAGKVVQAACSIALELEVEGWYSGDMHTHSEFSIDSQVRRHVRVASELAEGMSFWVATEHDVFARYAPVVESLGLQGVILPCVGNEVSPVGRHFNGLGCTPKPEQLQRYFVVPWVSFTPEGEVAGFLPAPAVWKSMHEDFGCKVVQLNHPRGGQGYFDFAKYDPAIGPSSAKPGELDLTFDAIEVWNAGEDWGHLEGATLVDWYSFLNRGHRKIATGNADTHDLSQWVGQPRNFVPVEGGLTEEGYFDSLLGSRSQVTSAPFIEFTLDEQGLGATVTPSAPGGSVTATIRVSAVSWAPLTTVRLIGNGEIVQEWDVSDQTGLVRLDTTAEITPEADTWYHVVAFAAAGDLAPLYPGRTSAALTNPIWVDLAGDGFDPPIPGE